MALGTAGSAVGSLAFANATSGAITVSPPTGALGTVALTLPDTAGTLALSTQPAFHAYLSSAQTISASTYAKVLFNSNTMRTSRR